ncbi:hypothetical protein ACLB2K_026260 [Fragaria x ananassa]
MYSHLALYGICSSYTVWTWHGETQVQMPTLAEIQAQHNQQARSSNASYGDPAVQSQQIEVLGTVLKTPKGKEVRGMGRAGERDLSHSSNGSTSCSRPPRVDEQQLLELQERYEQRLKESEERAQQKYQAAEQRALQAESMYSAMQS